MARLHLHGLTFEVAITPRVPATYATPGGDPGEPGEPPTIQEVHKVEVDDEAELIGFLHDAFTDAELEAALDE